MIKVDSKLRFDFGHALDKLTEAAGEETLRSVGFAGAAVFRDEVIREAPKDTGFLSENIGVVRATDKSDGSKVQTYLVKVLSIKTKYADTRQNRRLGRETKTYDQTKPFYWKFFEYGTSKMAARPFIRPSYEAQKDNAMQAMKAKLTQKISEALAKS